MATSRVGETIDKLVALWTSAVTAPARVWDGPEVTGDFSDALYIGYDGAPDGDFLAVEGEQGWAGLGAKRRDEEFDVVCAAVALAGDGIKAARDAAFALLAVAENTLRADPSLGFSPPCTAEIVPKVVFVEEGDPGYQVRIVFTVHVKTRV